MATAKAHVMLYDTKTSSWNYSGNSQSLAKVQLYFNSQTNAYRVVGWSLQDREVQLLLFASNTHLLPGFLCLPTDLDFLDIVVTLFLLCKPPRQSYSGRGVHQVIFILVSCEHYLKCTTSNLASLICPQVSAALLA